MEFLINFFAGYTAEELIVMLVTAVISVSQGLIPGVSVLEWLKQKTGLEGKAMHWTVIGFFMVLSALAMFVTGELDPEAIEWTLESLISYFGLFYGLSQIAYQRLKA
jgi:hypothetical protein